MRPVAQPAAGRATLRRMPAIVHVAAVDAPWGPVHLAAWDRGLVACESMTPLEPFVERLDRRLPAEVTVVPPPGPRRGRDPGRGLPRGPPSRVRPADRPDRPAAWDQAVLGAVCDVPWGSVASYGQIARAIDRAGAARAVGGAVARSPIGIVVPCHRIVAADGSLGGYGGDGLRITRRAPPAQARAAPPRGDRHPAPPPRELAVPTCAPVTRRAGAAVHSAGPEGRPAGGRGWLEGHD